MVKDMARMVTSFDAAYSGLPVLADNDLVDLRAQSPAVWDGQIFIRTERFLWAIGGGN